MKLSLIRSSQPLYVIATLIFLLEATLVTDRCFSFDRTCFLSWCNYVTQHGIQNIHSVPYPEFNYPPLIAYLLYGFGCMHSSIESIDRYFHFFKLISLFFDFVSAVLIVKMVRDSSKSVILLLLLVANPIFIYNSYLWGQCDSILTGLILLAFLSLMQSRFALSTIFFVMAINFKLQAIIFIPPLLLFYIYQFQETPALFVFMKSVIVGLVTQIVILLPFITHGKLSEVLHTFTSSVDFYTNVSMNAYNVWVLIMGEKSFQVQDTDIWYGLSYKKWGLVMFCVSSFFALLPMIHAILKRQFREPVLKLEPGSVLISFALIPLLFFYFNTQMHERYSHPAFAFVAAYSFISKRYYLFGLMCIAYFGNMERVAQLFDFPNYRVLILDPMFISIVYLTLIALLFFFLYLPLIGIVSKCKRQDFVN